MHKICARLMTLMGALTLVFTMSPGAFGQCGSLTRLTKPAAWNPQFRVTQPLLIRAAFEDEKDKDDRDKDRSIVGMWHVVFTTQTMNGAPFSTVLDNSIVVWHSDGTEIMNSSRPAQDGNFCLGVYARTGRSTYLLNHIPWQGNDPANAPSGIGNPTGGVQLLEKVKLSEDGNSYSGTFTFDAYDTTGHVTVSFTGVLSGKRITPTTPFADLL